MQIVRQSIETANHTPTISTGDPGALRILHDIDRLVEWGENAARKADTAGVRLALLVAQAARGELWRAKGCLSELEYIKNHYKGSESSYRQAKRIGTTLELYPLQLLEEIGISKCIDLCRIQDRYGAIESQWFDHARDDSRDEFRRRVRAAIGGMPGGDQLRTFKIFESAIPVYEQAMEIAKLESGSENPSNALTLIFADFLSSHNEAGARVRQGKMVLDVVRASILCAAECRDYGASLIEDMVGVISEALTDLKAQKQIGTDWCEYT